MSEPSTPVKSYKEIMNCEVQSESSHSDLLVVADKLIGTVKWFNSRSGYGFITVCYGEHAGKDIFVHYSSIDVANIRYKYLVQGEYVDFTLVKSENSEHEYQATQISGVKGDNIMCETHKYNPDNISPKISRTSPVKYNNTNPLLTRQVKQDSTVKRVFEHKPKTGYRHPRSVSSASKVESGIDNDGFTVVRKKNTHTNKQ